MSYNDAIKLASAYKSQNIPISLTSGGFAPLHYGHLSCLIQSAIYGQLFVAVNSDKFLKNKHGYAFMGEMDRVAIIGALACVCCAFIFESPKYVDECIRGIQPNFFCKGGDRSSLVNIAQIEQDACNDVGAKLMLGVGCDKVTSSSSILHNVCKFYEGNLYNLVKKLNHKEKVEMLYRARTWCNSYLYQNDDILLLEYIRMGGK